MSNTLYIEDVKVCHKFGWVDDSYGQVAPSAHIKWMTKEENGNWREALRLTAALEHQYLNSWRCCFLRLEMLPNRQNTWSAKWQVEMFGFGTAVSFAPEAWAMRISHQNKNNNYYYFCVVLDEDPAKWHMLKFDGIGAMTADVPLRRFAIA